MKTIVIDPGHGGADYGASYYGRYEKNDNLRLGLLVRDNLKRRGQTNVLMTRDSDVYVSLEERVAFSNRHNADLFISLHRNASENPNANGVENYVYYTAPQRTITYANNVLSAVVDVGVQSNRGLRFANFYVLRYTNAPAQLLEMGFVSNYTDNLMFDKYIEQYADAIAVAILQSLGEPVNPIVSKRTLTAELQSFLNNNYNAGLVVDGIFGAKTKAAVPLVRRGQTGSIVSLLQRALTLNGYHLTADGVFGPATETAVKNFQAARGLTVDGIVGPATFERLLT